MQSTSRNERRRHERRKRQIQLQLGHAPSGRKCPARSVDVSAGGMRLYVPANLPLAAGHELSLCMRNAPEQPEDSADTVSARVVRIERQELLNVGKLCVAICFDHEQPAAYRW